MYASLMDKDTVLPNSLCQTFDLVETRKPLNATTVDLLNHFPSRNSLLPLCLSISRCLPVSTSQHFLFQNQLILVCEYKLYTFVLKLTSSRQSLSLSSSILRENDGFSVPSTTGAVVPSTCLPLPLFAIFLYFFFLH